jgi:hypothetical protein
MTSTGEAQAPGCGNDILGPASSQTSYGSPADPSHDAPTPTPPWVAWWLLVMQSLPSMSLVREMSKLEVHDNGRG